MIRSVERFLPYLLLIPAILPLLFIDGLLYPYLAPKTLVLRAVGVAAIAGFATLFLAGRTFYIDRLKIWHAWIPGALLIWTYIASFFGIDFYHSFWSVFDRGDGLLTLTVIIALFYVTLLTATNDWYVRFVKTVAIVASLVAAFTFLQWLQQSVGDIPLVPGTDGRIGGTLGNAAFLASYLGMTLFITLASLTQVKRKWEKWVYVGAGLQLFGILASATRGAFLGLIAALGVTVLYYAFKEGKYRSYAQGALVALVVAAGLFFMFRAQLAEVPIEVVRRVATISLADATVESRLFIWSTVGMEALSSPIVGVGAEHAEVLFNRVYDPTRILEQWFDRTHNAFLDYFVQFGLPGLVLYGALLIAIVRKAYELYRSKEREDERLGRLVILLLVTYVVQNFFVFDTATTLWLLFILLAVLIVKTDVSKARAILPRALPLPVAAGAGVVLLALVIPVSIQPLRANLYLADGYLYHVANVSRANASMEKGLALNTYADLEYGYQLYEMYTDRQAVMLDTNERIDGFRMARDVLEANYEKYPYDARTATYLAHVHDMTPPELERDEERLKEVVARAIELSPKRLQPWYILANLSLRKGDALPEGSVGRAQFYEAGINVLSEYSKLVPTYSEPHFVIATLYQSIGQSEKAAEWAASGLLLYSRPDEAIARRAARYYIAVEDWENARRFLREVVRSKPTDYGFTYDLAKAEFLAGNIEEAGRIVGELQEKVPGFVEQDQAFLSALQAQLQ